MAASNPRMTRAAAAAARLSRIDGPLTGEDAPLTRLPLELMLHLVDFLEPQAYLDLSSTCRTLRSILKQPAYLKRVIAYPQGSHLPRAWEDQSRDPYFEQLVLHTTFPDGSEQHLHCAWPPAKPDWMRNTWTLSVSNDGRYAAYSLPHWMSKGSAGGLCLWDIFANSCRKVEDINLGYETDCGLSLRSEHDLLVMYGSGVTKLWHLSDLSTPIHARHTGVFHHDTDAQYGLANHCKSLIFSGWFEDTLSVLDVGGLERREDAAATVLVWSGVQFYNYSPFSPDVLIATNNDVEHWSVNGQQSRLVRSVKHSHFPARLASLTLSSDGKRAVASLQSPASQSWGWPRATCTWALDDATWTLTQFSSLYEENSSPEKDSLLSSDGRFYAYQFKVPAYFVSEPADDRSDIECDDEPFDDPVDMLHVATVVHDLHELEASPLAFQHQHTDPIVDEHWALRVELLFGELRAPSWRQNLPVLDRPDPSGKSHINAAARKRLRELGVQYVPLSYGSPFDFVPDQEAPMGLRVLLDRQRLRERFSSPNNLWAVAKNPRGMPILPTSAPNNL